MCALDGSRATAIGGGAGRSQSCPANPIPGPPIALCLARRHCDVGVLDRDAEGAERVATKIRGLSRRGFLVQVNEASKQDIGPALEPLMTEFGSVDILVNGAGTVRINSLLEVDEADWSETFRMNVDAVTRSVLTTWASRLQAARGGHQARHRPGHGHALIAIS